MFNKPDKRLQRLNEELLAEEENDWLEEEEEYEDELDFEDIDELLNQEADEEADDEEEEMFEEDSDSSTLTSRYGRGKPTMFDFDAYENEDDDEDDLADEEFLYQEDYKKAKKKKRRKGIGLVILAITELIAIAVIAIWWASWVL